MLHLHIPSVVAHIIQDRGPYESSGPAECVTDLFLNVGCEMLAGGLEKGHQGRVDLTSRPLRVHLTRHLHTLNNNTQ